MASCGDRIKCHNVWSLQNNIFEIHFKKKKKIEFQNLFLFLYFSFPTQMSTKKEKEFFM